MKPVYTNVIFITGMAIVNALKREVNPIAQGGS